MSASSSAGAPDESASKGDSGNFTADNKGQDGKPQQRGRRGPPEVSSRWLYAVDEEWRPFDDEDNARLEKKWAKLIKQGKLKKRRRRRGAEGENKGNNKGEGEGQRDDDDEENASKDKAQKGDDEANDGEDEKSNSLGDKLSSMVGDGGKKVGEAISSGATTPQLKGDDSKDKSDMVNEHLDPDASPEERMFRVEVMEDKLFDVDLESMMLFPVFWKGVLLPVTRAHWFYSAVDGGYAPIPSDGELSRDLDEAYNVVKPYKRFAREKSVQEIGEESANETDGEEEAKDASARARQEKIKQDAEQIDAETDALYELKSMEKDCGQVHFKSETLGHIFTKDVKGKFMAAFGGNLVVRGWDAAAQRSNRSRMESLLDSSNLPWSQGRDPDEEQDGDTSGSAQNDRRGAKHAQRQAGAAKGDSAPQMAGSDGSTSSSSEEKEASQGLFTRMIPSTSTLMRPDIALRRALGWSKDDANAESQRQARQKNTEEGLRKDKDNDDDSGDDDDPREPISDERVKDPPELVLVIHGIGQKLTEDFDALDFVYDVERLRNLSKSLAKHPDLRRISKGKRVQFLPICWRRDLSFDDADPIEGNDNRYGLRDVSNDASIPIVRTVISKVVLDVPYYLSRHQERMISSVKAEVNRIYRLFAQRNPSFEKDGGRANLICHSLGSCLAVDILSNQPTCVPPLSEQREGFDAPLCFNVKNLFFVGSPNGFFLHLNGGQLIARKGTKRTRNLPDEIARNEVGRYGCLAAESVYNCFNTTDPVAFQLGATVDREYSRMLRPIALSEAVPALLEALSMPRLSLSKYFEVVHPFSKAGNVAAMSTKTGNSLIDKADRVQKGTKAAKKARKEGGGEEEDDNDDEDSSERPSDRPVLVEKGAEQKKHQLRSKAQGNRKGSFDFERLQRAEKRFRALNPHGCIDFTFESGGVNQYLEMLSAHVSYWTSKTFATFVLTQLWSEFSSDEEAQPDAPSLVPEIDLSRKRQFERQEEEEGAEEGPIQDGIEKEDKDEEQAVQQEEEEGAEDGPVQDGNDNEDDNGNVD